jgi:hypothetical protein
MKTMGIKKKCELEKDNRDQCQTQNQAYCNKLNNDFTDVVQKYQDIKSNLVSNKCETKK